ncbi:MAG: phage tape measure protein [Polaromonas sp.]|nr:phage tape measure protein [Polaromonas sp.]
MNIADGFELVVRTAMAAARPDPELHVDQWSEEFMVLPKSAPHPGPFRFERTPYARRIAQVLSPGHAAVAWGSYTLSQKLAAAGSTQSAIAIEQAALAATSQAVASGRAAVATSTHGKAAVLAASQVAGYGAANTGAAAAAGANAAQVAAGATGYRAIGGAVLSAASKFALWGTVAYEGYSILKSTGVALGEGIAKWQGYKNAEEVMAEQEKKLAAAAQATADAVYKQSEAARVAKDQSFGLSKEAGLLAVKFDTLVKAGDSASDAIGKIGKDFDLSRLPGIRDAAGVLDKLKADGKLTAAEFQAAWAKALDGKDLAVFETTAKAAFMGTKREAELLAQLLDAGLRESVKRAGLDFDNLKGGISATARSAVNDTQTIIDGLGRLSAQGVDTGRALAASIGKGIDTADTQKALDLVKQQIEAVRAKLGETVANGLLDQAKQKGLELKDALEKAMPGINSLREAMGQLGITSDQTFKDTAEKSKAAYDVMRTSGLASARELSEGFKKSAEDAITANKGIAPTWVTAEAAARGYEVQVDSAGKATVRAAGEGVKGVDGLANAYKNAGDAAESAGNRAVSALEKQNAAQERLNAATDKAAELERKRQAIDKEGFSTGKDGQRVVAGTDVGTLTGVAAFLKAAGVSDDAAARKLALEFSDGKGNIPYINNAAQVKYGGRSSTMTQALLRAAESYTFGTGSGSAKSPSTIPAPGTTVNINLNGTTQSINTDAAGAATLQNILRQLGGAQSTSSLR